MRVLVISHNVFSKTGNMGKTLASMFSFMPQEDIAQLYLHSEVPTMRLCERYYRVNDKDVLRSVFTRKANYQQFGSSDVQEQRDHSRIDTGVISKAYQYAQKRTPWIYFARNLLWKIGKWDCKELRKWVDDFAPDVIFYASGDYAFSYDIAYRLSKRHNAPIVFWCCDDYYTEPREKGILASYNYKKLMSSVKKVCSRSSAAVVICDEMKRDYGKILNLSIEALRISVDKNPYQKSAEQRKGILYAGNLGLNRTVPLLELGRALKKAGLEGYDHIDVYSGERDPSILSTLTEENGIHFHGAVSIEEVNRLLGTAKYLLHVEAFDEASRKATRYSLSTKIGESLQSGACILAYGPKEISSMRYLSENRAACILDHAQDISQRIAELNENPDQYEEFLCAAQNLADLCHNKEKNYRLLEHILQQAAENGIYKKDEDFADQ